MIRESNQKESEEDKTNKVKEDEEFEKMGDELEMYTK